MTIDTHDALERKAKKERKKLRKLDLSSLSNEDDTALMSGDKHQETAVEEKKTKRKDKRKQKDHLNGSDIARSGSESTSKKKPKRKKDDNASETQPDIDHAATELRESTGDVALSAETSREAKRGKKKGGQNEEEELAAETEKKEKKKRKREGDGTSHGEGDSEVPKKKKKRKPQNEAIGLPNPSSDTTLTDQARKALVYAYAQIDDPPSWKFNKARQNWLIRNIWSESAIPEIYEPILTRYIVGIQGGVRDNLVKLCQSTLEPAQHSSVQVAPSEDADKSLIGSTSQQENAGPLTSVETSSTETVKRRRARAILDVLITPDL